MYSKTVKPSCLRPSTSGINCWRRLSAGPLNRNTPFHMYNSAPIGFNLNMQAPGSPDSGAKIPEAAIYVIVAASKNSTPSAHITAKLSWRSVSHAAPSQGRDG